MIYSFYNLLTWIWQRTDVTVVSVSPADTALFTTTVTVCGSRSRSRIYTLVVTNLCIATHFADSCKDKKESKTIRKDTLLLHCENVFKCSVVYKQNTTEKWTKGCILFFHKKGDLGITKNFRGIITFFYSC